MKAAFLVLLLLILAAIGTSADTAWNLAAEAELDRLVAGTGRPPISAPVMKLVLEEAGRELGSLPPAEAALLVVRDALDADICLRLGTPLARVHAQLRQALRIAAGAGGNAVARLETLHRLRQRMEEATRGGAPSPGEHGPFTDHGRWGG